MQVFVRALPTPILLDPGLTPNRRIPEAFFSVVAVPPEQYLAMSPRYTTPPYTSTINCPIRSYSSGKTPRLSRLHHVLYHSDHGFPGLGSLDLELLADGALAGPQRLRGRAADDGVAQVRDVVCFVR